MVVIFTSLYCTLNVIMHKAITVKVEDAAEVEKNASEMAMPFNFVDDTNGAGNVCNFILHNIPPNAVIAVRYVFYK